MGAVDSRFLIWHLLTTTDERLPNPLELDKVYDASADTVLMFWDGDWRLIVGPPYWFYRSWN